MSAPGAGGAGVGGSAVGSSPSADPNGTKHLAHRASRGILVTMGGLWSKTLIQMASTIVLARLLTPADFGLIAMVTAIVGIADLIRDFGMTGAIIQSRELSERMWRSVLWFSVALSSVLTILVAASAPLIAALYGEPRLILLTLVIAPALLFNGVAMPMQARLSRELRFGELARIDVLAMVAGVLLSIAAAFAGWGVWSLIVLNGAGGIVRFVMLWIAVKPKFGKPHISREVLPLVATGSNIFGAEALNYAERNSDNVIIGAVLGPAAVGQYSRAYALFLLPLQQMNGPIGRVALPVLSKLRDEPERYRRYIRGAVLVIGYLTLTTYAIAAAVSPALIGLLLGPNWDQAAVIFSLLAIAGVAQALGKVRGWLYITMGRSHRQFLYDLVARPIVIVGFFVGIWWNGVYGLTLVYGILSLLLLIPGFFFAIRGTFVRAGDVVLPILRPAIAGAFAYGAAWYATSVVDWVEIAELALGCAAGILPLALAMLIPAYRRDVRVIIDFARKMRKPRAVEPSEPAGQAIGEL
jgi:O-antigen/teichoic acid export membrane protein